MTRKTFYAKLRTVKNKFRWVTDNGALRAYSKKKSVAEEFCPLTAVHFILNGEDLGVGDFDKAARALGVNEEDAAFIVHVADSPAQDLNGHDILSRQSLLKNVGLKPEKRVPVANGW